MTKLLLTGLLVASIPARSPVLAQQVPAADSTQGPTSAAAPVGAPVAASAGAPVAASRVDTSRQGIEGVVYRAGGNRMPAPHTKPTLPQGVAATLFIFQLTNISQVTREGQSGYYSSVHTLLVRQADTDEKGYFKVLLPAGRYSIFTKKGDLFYATRMDEKNNIAPVEVLPHAFTKTDCKAASDHLTTY